MKWSWLSIIIIICGKWKFIKKYGKKSLKGINFVVEIFKIKCQDQSECLDSTIPALLNLRC